MDKIEREKLERLIKIHKMFEELNNDDQQFIAGVIEGLSFKKVKEA